MLKQTLIAAAALATIALGTTTAADAGYGYRQYGGSYYNTYSPQCVTKTRSVTIRVWDDYSCEYAYRTVYRDYEVCY